MTIETNMIHLILAILMPVGPLIAALVLAMNRVMLGGATALSAITTGCYAYILWRVTGWLSYLTDQKLTQQELIGPLLTLGTSVSFICLSTGVLLLSISWWRQQIKTQVSE